MKEIVQILLTILATSTFILSLSEVLLTEAQKRYINNLTIKAWNKLDDLKRRALLDWVKAKGLWLVGIGAVSATAFVFWLLSRNIRLDKGISSNDIIVPIVIFLPGLLFGFYLARWTLSASSLFYAAFRATCFIACAYLPMLIIELSENYFIMAYVPKNTNFELTKGVFAVSFAIVMIAIISAFFMILGVIFWLPVGAPLLVIYIFSILIFAAELFVRRLAEFQKGTLVGLAIVSGSLVVLLKLFN